MTYRVAAFSTGGVGRFAIRAIARRADLDLVGVWVHSPEKAGVDAGVLAGIDPIGLSATNDFEAILALEPDCVCFSAADRTGDAATAMIARILGSGINVVTVSLPPLIYPPGVPPQMREPLAAAAAKGNATL